MKALGLLGNAFVGVCHPASLFLMIAGVAVGIIFGSIPGLSASMAVALFLPLTFSMTPSMGMNTLVAVYFRRFDFRDSFEYARNRLLHCNHL